MQERRGLKKFALPGGKSMPFAQTVKNLQGKRGHMIGMTRLLIVTGAQNKGFLK